MKLFRSSSCLASSRALLVSKEMRPSVIVRAAHQDTNEIVQRHSKGQPSTSFSSREEHNAEQARFFDQQTDFFLKPAPESVERNLARIVEGIPGLSAESRVCDVGAGTGCLIPHLRAKGVQDILAVDLSEKMLAALRSKFSPENRQDLTPTAATVLSASPDAVSAQVLGNVPIVRTWKGDLVDLPYFYGPFDFIFFNAVFGNFYDQKATLIKAVTLMKPGSCIVISHPMGRAFVDNLHRTDPVRVPHSLPDRPALDSLLADLPLRCTHFEDGPEGPYSAVLQVPELFSLPDSATLRLSAPIVRGFGRGSRDLGFPTANLDPAQVAAQLEGRPPGVYFGWARLHPKDPSQFKAGDLAVHPMVMNVGRRPTMEDNGGVTIEVHVPHTFSQKEFYGERMDVLVCGFLRPEIKFKSLGELTTRILIDVGLARTQLADPGLVELKSQL